MSLPLRSDGSLKPLTFLFYPILYNLASVGSEHTLGMELYAVYVVLTVAQRHDHAVVRQCGNFKTRWYGVAVYYPTVVCLLSARRGRPLLGL